MDEKWNTDDPPKHGYYLATWIRNGDTVIVSELWFNPDPSPNWWIDRSYFNISIWGKMVTVLVGKVIGWMPLLKPAKRET